MNEKYPLKLHPQSNNENYLYSFSITKKYIIFEFSHKHLFFSDVGTMTLFFFIVSVFFFYSGQAKPAKSSVGTRGRPPKAAAKSKDAWFIPAIQCHEPDDGVFFAQIGPTGGPNGYPAITGEKISSFCLSMGV